VPAEQADEEVAAEEPARPAPPSPYSLPWQLRPAVAASALRSDTVVAFQDQSRTVVSFLSASWKAAEDVALSARYGWVQDAPKSQPTRSALTNLGLAALYAPKVADAFRIALSGGVVLPIAQGGGDTADPDAQKAIATGSYARSAMDNAMFGANDLGLFGGAALVYLASGLTVQLESTLFYLARVKGAAVQPDERKANTTWGVHVGYFVIPEVSIGAELRYQDFLLPPSAVQKAPARRDAATAAIGVRGHFALGGGHVLHPGISYTHPLDDPMAAAGYRIVQVDVPFVF
jgi:hypothetical protein